MTLTEFLLANDDTEFSLYFNEDTFPFYQYLSMKYANEDIGVEFYQQFFKQKEFYEIKLFCWRSDDATRVAIQNIFEYCGYLTVERFFAAEDSQQIYLALS